MIKLAKYVRTGDQVYVAGLLGRKVKQLVVRARLSHDKLAHSETGSVARAIEFTFEDGMIGLVHPLERLTVE